MRHFPSILTSGTKMRENTVSLSVLCKQIEQENTALGCLSFYIVSIRHKEQWHNNCQKVQILFQLRID